MVSRYSNWLTLRWKKRLEFIAQEVNSGTAKDIQARIAASTIVSPDDILEGRVQFGSRVTVFGLEEEEEQSFEIVSRDEAESAPGLLDESSPLAQALYGAIEGEVVNVILANGSNSDYEVTHINLPSQK